jgi:hypothetical protein
VIASLPMYARPENRAAHEALWALIRDGLRARGVAAPDALDHEIDHMAGWARPDLVLGQICNLPYRARFRDRVTLIGASDYGLEGCGAGRYRSLLVVRRDDAAATIADCDGYRLAYNETLSQSGWAAAWAAARGAGLTFAQGPHTHAHRVSMSEVIAGRADIAAIDAHTFAMAEAYQPDLARGLRVIGASHASPGMSFITRQDQDPAPYFAAIAAAIEALPPTDRATLGLRGIVALPAEEYREPLPPAIEDLPDWAA